MKNPIVENRKLQHLDAKESDFKALVPRIYEELRVIARNHLRRNGRMDTLNTTSLVHETYLKLHNNSKITLNGDAYLYASISKCMRQILVDRARHKYRSKREGGKHHVQYDDANTVVKISNSILELDNALEHLQKLHQRATRVVELRYFGGLSVKETAKTLNISERTVKSDWKFATQWIKESIN